MTRLALSGAVLLASASGTTRAQAVIDLHHVSLADADFGPAAELGGREDGLLLRTPKFDVAGGGFDVAADYTYTHYEYSGLATRDRDLHRLELPLTWTGNSRTHGRIGVVPTVAASSNVFKDLFSRGGGDDFSLYGHASIERLPSQGWGWRAGVAYDDAFGDERAYPLLALLHDSDAVTLALGWPHTRVDWHVHPQVDLGLDIAPAGGRWHVVSDERDGAEFFYITKAWRAQLLAQWAITPHWHLDATVGYEFDRSHEFEDDNGARIDEDVDSTILYGVNVAYRF
ncbi:hypothetical protein MNR01_09360 [Lysobacter sp. S4-A87]|uniref:hypothetical protein n=1 Tax=Lysobacter sp. S4-A87 TaxID=2925843 RepID=UPI001F533107|nr:hypothetical protein [Lysobacter sp. S4-A87]UNK47999.1 hypothetical protein MNR01_09360 [Lysobacter sp. S4-A87]